MSISLLTINSQNPEFADRAINFLGMVIIPLILWFISSVIIESNKRKDEEIQKLNYLTLNTHNLINEAVNIKLFIERKKSFILKYIENPSIENFNAAFSLQEFPTLIYDIFPQDYVFTAKNHANIVHFILYVQTRIKDIACKIQDFNRIGILVKDKSDDEKRKGADVLLAILEDLKYNCNLLLFCLCSVDKNVQCYNYNFLFEQLISIDLDQLQQSELKKAEQEIDERNKYACPNWRAGLVKTPDENPTKLNFRGRCYILFLFVWGAWQKFKKSFLIARNKLIYEKFKPKPTTYKVVYSEETINTLIQNAKNIQNQILSCFQKLCKLEVSNPENIKRINYFFKRVYQMVGACQNIYTVFPPARNTILLEDERTNVKINLDFLVQNFFLCLNELCKFTIKQIDLDVDVNEIKWNSDKIQKYIPEEYYKELYESDFIKFSIAYLTCLDNGNDFELGTLSLAPDDTWYIATAIFPPITLQQKGLNGYELHFYVNDIMSNLIEHCDRLYPLILKSTPNLKDI